MKRIGIAVGFVAAALLGTSITSAFSGASAGPSGPASVKEKRVAKSVKRGPRGRRGPRGLPGPRGPQGPAGIAGIEIVESPEQVIPPGGTSSVELAARCPSGTVVVGTGFDTGIGRAVFVRAFGTSLVGGFVYNDTGIAIDGVTVQAMCGVVSDPSRTESGAEGAVDDFGAAVSRARSAIGAL